MADPVFFKVTEGVTVGRIAEAVGARLVDTSRADQPILRASQPSDATPGALIFIDGQRNAALLAGSHATAVLCRPEHVALVPAGAVALECAHPQTAFVAAIRLLYPDAILPAAITGQIGIAASAIVSPEARLEDDVIVEAGAVIGARAEIGAGTIIGPNAVIGPDCRIGRDCRVGAGATIQHALIGNRVIMHPGVRLGQDGFGYIGARNGPEKVLQLGRVILQDDVELGANSTIDRGALSDTVIGEKTKIDNLVQIAHNVTIGRGCVIAGQCGISGSVRIGNFVRIGGGAGISDHVSVGDGAQLAARSGVMNDVPAGENWGGAPAMPIRQYLRQFAVMKAHAKAGNGKAGKTK